MPSTATAGAIVAAQTQDATVSAAGTALVVYKPPDAEPTASDSLADVTKASKQIRDNTLALIDMVEDSFSHCDMYTTEETEEMLSMVRGQFDELFLLSMDIKEHTEKSLRKSRKHLGADLQHQALQFMGREQQLTTTINIQQEMIQTLQQNLSHLTLHTGLMRGENHGLTNENLVLRQRLEQIENSKKVLHDLSKDMSTSLGNHDKQMKAMQEQCKVEVGRLIKELERQKLAYGQVKSDYQSRLTVIVKEMIAIKTANQKIKAQTEETVNATLEEVDKKCALIEHAEKIHARYQALQEKEKNQHQKHLEELRSSKEKEEKAKKKEMEAVKKYEESNAKFEKLQILVKTRLEKARASEEEAAKKNEEMVQELEGKQKAYNDLLTQFNDVKDLAEDFARQAREATERELNTLAELKLMIADGRGQK